MGIRDMCLSLGLVLIVFGFMVLMAIGFFPLTTPGTNMFTYKFYHFLEYFWWYVGCAVSIVSGTSIVVAIK